MSRDLGWRDFTATSAATALAGRLGIDILHGHGAKGGAYARLAARRLGRGGRHVAAFYTPHGGSLHYAPSSLKGRIFMALERSLAGVTDGIVFESAYSSRVYASHVGAGRLSVARHPQRTAAARVRRSTRRRRRRPTSCSSANCAG